MTRKLVDLPDDIIYVLLKFCDVKTVGRLAQVCRRLSALVSRDCVWLSVKGRLTCIFGCSSSDCCCQPLPVRELCRLSKNWNHGRYRKSCVICHRVRQMPWLQLNDECLWSTNENAVECFFLPAYSRETCRGESRHARDQRIHRDGRRTVRLAGVGDVCRFVCKEKLIVAGTSEGYVCAFNTDAGFCLPHYQPCHIDVVHSLDFTSSVIVSGSRDATVKISRLPLADDDADDNDVTSPVLGSLSVGDRVWSVAISPNDSWFVCGTAAIHQRSPLYLWQLDRIQQIGTLGQDYRHGAGILDIHFDSAFTLLTCGYDTIIRLWDLRASLHQCVSSWEEPFDSALYCVKSDGRHAFLVGTSRHSLVRLWDKRHRRPVQMYYTARVNSPVYSLVFNSRQLFCALDSGVHCLNFSLWLLDYVFAAVLSSLNELSFSVNYYIVFLYTYSLNSIRSKIDALQLTILKWNGTLTCNELLLINKLIFFLMK